MATGKLGFVTGGLTTGIGVPVSVYTVPTTTYTVFNISVTNTASTSCTIRIALSSAATYSAIDAGEYIEYGTTVIGNGVFERTGLVAGTGQKVWVSTSGASGTVAVTVYGIETSTV